MIVAVAIIHRGVVYSLPRPNRHHHVIRLIAERTGADRVDGEQGFLDDLGNFLNRETALLHALACGQVPPPKARSNRRLYSEDLW
jgi:hypothetical protein